LQHLIRKLSYFVFERQELVAAFAMRDDAENWIEECGSRAMKLREVAPPRRPVQSFQSPPHRGNTLSGQQRVGRGRPRSDG
jgi:hypothetical protein